MTVGRAIAIAVLVVGVTVFFWVVVSALSSLRDLSDDPVEFDEGGDL